MNAGLGDGGACHLRNNIALRWLAKDIDLGYNLFAAMMRNRERSAKNLAEKEIVTAGKIYSAITEGLYSV